MKSPPETDVHDLPLSELRLRVARVCLMLHDMRARVGGASSHHGMRCIDEALGTVARLLPGFSEPPRSLVARTVRTLAPVERRALRDAIETERAARDRVKRLLGQVPPAQAEDALARVEAVETVAAALSLLFRSVDAARLAPAAAASHS